MTPDWTAWIHALVGGTLIGAAAVLLLAFNGRVLGVSGIIGSLVKPKTPGRAWRAAFLAGMLAAGYAATSWVGAAANTPSPTSLPGLVVAGLLVGVGTAVGSGCTSGHGVCGIGRLSKRSFVATLIFIGCGMATVFVVSLLGGA